MVRGERTLGAHTGEQLEQGAILRFRLEWPWLEGRAQEQKTRPEASASVEARG